jgi:hypothetical protein
MGPKSGLKYLNKSTVFAVVKKNQASSADKGINSHISDGTIIWIHI